MTALAQLGLDLGPDGLLAGYRPLPGVRDEAVDVRGAPRAHWAPVFGAFAEAGAEAMARGFAAAERHLRESGVFYRIYDEAAGAERPWPLSHPPLVLAGQEWADLARGVVQRAELIESILTDIYGPGRLVSDGILPASVVAGSREFLRPLVGARPAGGRFLRVYAADLTRRPDGRWEVASDRTQAPSGSGYAVENRIAVARAFPDLVSILGVEPITGFFETLRAGLGRLAGRDDARIAVLTPGSLNETYFEHAYLARSLGFVLVEGADLTVAGDALYVRTVEGLKRLDVVLRRLDADFADPILLNPDSRLGVPGLVRAVRAGAVAMANALGTGFAEAPALVPFLPALARRLLGEELMLPSAPVYWSGRASDRAAALDRLDSLVVAGGTFPVGDPLARGPVAVADLDAPTRRRLAAALVSPVHPIALRLAPRHSTMPVFESGRLTPRPFALRLFATYGPAGWTVMPGGLCRIADSGSGASLSMQQGGRSADVWVVGQQQQGPTETSVGIAGVEVRRAIGPLPSRAADNLFWLGRYLERTEAILRVVRAIADRAGEPEGSQWPAGPARRLANLLATWNAVPVGPTEPLDIAAAVLQARDPSGTPAALIAEARRTASIIRDRLSSDAWKAFVDIVSLVDDTQPGIEPFEKADRALRAIAAFAGVVEETMNRLAGWRFLKIGRRIERAIATCRFVRQLGSIESTPATLDALLELADSRSTYRGRYLVGPLPAPVLDLVLLDPANPRSVAFQMERIVDHLAMLPLSRREGMLALPTERVALRLQAQLRTATTDDIDEAHIVDFEHELMALSDAVTELYVTPGAVVAPSADALG